MKKITNRQIDELRRIHAKLSELLSYFDIEPVTISPQVAKEVERKLAERICLACGLRIEDHERPKRGQHPGCYSTTRGRIARGEYTEDAEIQRGRLTAETKRAGRPAKQDRTKAFPGLEALPDKQQIAVRMKFIDGSDDEAIAEALSVSIGAVRTLIGLGVDSLNANADFKSYVSTIVDQVSENAVAVDRIKSFNRDDIAKPKRSKKRPSE